MLSLNRTNLVVLALTLAGAAHGYTTHDSKLGVIDASENSIVASPLTDSSSGNSPKIRIVKRQPSASVTYAKDYSYSSSRYNEPIQVKVDGSGNVYVLGDAYTSDYSTRTLFLLKYSPSGSLSWSKPYTASSLFADGLALDSSGNAYVAADWNGVARILKYDSSGNVSVNRVLQPQAQTSLENIAIDSSNRVYVAGNTGPGTVGGTVSTLVARYDTSLNQVWQSVDSTIAGGNTGLAIDASGNAVTTYGALNNNTLTYSASIKKSLLSNGGTAWYQIFDAMSPGGFDASAGVIVDANGDVVLAGQQTQGPLNSQTYNMRIAKLSGSNGNALWNTAYAMNTASQFRTSALCQDAGGTYLVVGTNRNTSGTDLILTPAFNGSGSNVGYWSVAPNQYQEGLSIVPTSTANSYYIGGTTENDFSSTVSYPLQGRVLNNAYQWTYYWNSNPTP